MFSCSKYRTVLFCHDFLSLDEGLFIVFESTIFMGGGG